jgi:hypothetical protein
MGLTAWEFHIKPLALAREDEGHLTAFAAAFALASACATVFAGAFGTIRAGGWAWTR